MSQFEEVLYDEEERKKELIKEFEELEKLTLSALKTKTKRLKEELKEYNRESERKMGVIETAIKAKNIIEIYKNAGFKGLYKYLDYFRGYPDPGEGRECVKDDIPF